MSEGNKEHQREYKITTQVVIPADVVVDAVATGLAYSEWCECGGFLRAELDKPGWHFYVQDRAGDMPEYTMIVNWERLTKGLEIMARKYPSIFQQFVDGDVDWVAGDQLLQCAVIGSIQYS